jgi:hypothetical protein
MVAVALSWASLVLPAQAFLCDGISRCAYTGYDRALAYGLKYSEGFGFSCLACIRLLPELMPNQAVNLEAAR